MSARVVPIRRRTEIQPLGVDGVRMLGLQLRCKACGFEWRADLDPFLAVVPETARCPRCEANKQPPSAA